MSYNEVEYYHKGEVVNITPFIFEANMLPMGDLYVVTGTEKNLMGIMGYEITTYVDSVPIGMAPMLYSDDISKQHESGGMSFHELMYSYGASVYND